VSILIPTSCDNIGIGYETVKFLARRGAKVYLGARDESKATGALEKLKEEGLSPGDGQVIWLGFDYSDPRLAKKAAEEFLKRETRLDILSTLFPIDAPIGMLINANIRALEIDRTIRKNQGR
jgi:NAD(P)-dependent dehydrogenase (short-subunit alcohol dehydrogenase family)